MDVVQLSFKIIPRTLRLRLVIAKTCREDDVYVLFYILLKYSVVVETTISVYT